MKGVMFRVSRFGGHSAMRPLRSQLCRPSRRFAALLALASLGASGCRTLVLPGMPVFEWHALETAPLSAKATEDGVEQAVWQTENLTSHGTIQLIRAQSFDEAPSDAGEPARLSVQADE